MTTTEHAVVIAGGGPTGLMLAGELALAGVDVVIVERRADSGGRRLARRRSALPHDRGARSARHRRAVPRGRDRSSPERPSTSATSRPATTTGSRCGRASSSPSWPAGSSSSGFRSCAAARWWASRRTTPASTSSCPTARRSAAEYLVGCDGGRSVVRKAAGIDFPGLDPSTSWMIAEVEMDEEPEIGLRRDGGGIGPVNRADRRRAVRRRAQGTRARPRPRAHPRRSPRGADRRDGTDYGVHSPTLDLPLHRHDAAGGVVPRRDACCSRATPRTCIPRRAARASTSACRTP